MQFAYLLALLLSIAGTAIIDWRHRLFLARDLRAASLVLLAGVVFFVVWDLVGVALGVFFRGESPYMTGWLLAPEMPVEEIFFLILMCQTTMCFWAAGERWLARRATGGRP